MFFNNIFLFLLILYVFSLVFKDEHKSKVKNTHDQAPQWPCRIRRKMEKKKYYRLIEYKFMVYDYKKKTKPGW